MNLEVIKSLKDPRIQLARQLNSLKGRAEKNKYLIEGFEAIGWVIQTDVKIDFILFSDKISDIHQKYLSKTCYRISDGLLKKVTDTNYVIPAVAVGNLENVYTDRDFVVVLDDVNDFGNIGTIIRTCHAFGIDSVISSKSKMDLFQRKTVDASRGKVFSTKIKKFDDPGQTAAYLKSKGYQVITTSPYGDKIQSLVSLENKPAALVVGNESDGVSQELMEAADVVIQIPMQSEVESLNVGVATGISIYELKLKQVMGMIEKKIKSTLGRELNVIAMLVRDALDAELRKVSDLTSLQLVFMMVLKCDTFMTVTEIQKQFGIPDNEFENFIVPLILKQCVMKNNPEEYAITESGVETISKLWTVIENTENKIMADFSEEEKQEFRRSIGKMKTKCVEIIG